MKKITILLSVIIAAVFLFATANAQDTTANDKTPTLKITGVTSGAIQFLQQDNDLHNLPHIPWGFQSARGNLNFAAHVADGIDIFFNAFLSSNHHVGQWYDDEGYINISKLPESSDILGLNNTLFKYVTLTAGFIPVDYGLWWEIRSDNADVQRNPLVGNYIVDANDVEPSVQVKTKPGLLNALVAFGDGTTTGDFTPGRGNEVNAKVWLNLKNEFQLAGSIYRSNQANNGTGYPTGGSTTDLYAGNRSGSQYSGIFGDNPEAGDIAPQKGQDVTAFQFDGYYNLKPLQVFGMYGYTKDADINGSAPGNPQESWSYFGGDVTYYLFPALYVAARYSAAISKMYQGIDVSANPVSAGRFQVGAGVWVTNAMLLKLEYVDQQYKNFPAASGYGYNTRFHGFTTQFSVAF